MKKLTINITKISILTFVLLVAITGITLANDVVIYTAHHADIVNELIPMFEEKTGLTTNVVRAGSGEIIQRVKAEKERPLGDIIWSIGGEALEANSDLLQSYTPKEHDKLNSKFMIGTNWLPYTGIPMVIIVNTDLLDEDEYPTEWGSLVDPKWKGRFIYAGADVSGSAYTQLANIISIYGEEEGWPLVEKMMANATIAPSSGQVPRGVADGEYAVGFTLEEAANRYVMGDANVDIVYPEDGVPAIPDGSAMIKNSPNPENAQKFLDFILSKEAQEFLVEKMQRRSVRTDVAPPGGLPKLSNLNFSDYDMGWAAENRNEIITKWQRIIRQ